MGCISVCFALVEYKVLMPEIVNEVLEYSVVIMSYYIYFSYVPLPICGLG